MDKENPERNGKDIIEITKDRDEVGDQINRTERIGSDACCCFGIENYKTLDTINILLYSNILITQPVVPLQRQSVPCIAL